MTSAPPVSSIISSRYATALIDLAEEAGAIGKVEKDLKILESLIRELDDLAAVIRSPLTSKEQQGQLVSSLAKQAKLQDLTNNFLNVLIQNRRLYALERILKAAMRELSVRRGEVTANVQTASALSPKQKEDLQRAISKAVGSEVSLQTEVNSDILGGVIVTVGSRMVDDSVRRKLARLRSAMDKQANQNVIQEVREA